MRTSFVLSLALGSAAAEKMNWDNDLLEEDESFWGRMMLNDVSMSTPTGAVCVKDFKVLESLVEASKDSVDALSIRLCEDSIINFDEAIDMSGARFFMMCEGDSCRLDGQGKTNMFKAGNFNGPFSTHDVSFDTIQFFNGATTVRI